MQTVMITGGTGLIGKTLTAQLVKRGYEVIILTRQLPKEPAHNHTSYALWDVTKQTIDVAAVQSADYIIHLAGAGVVDKKWTPAYKKEILDSRTKSSDLLITALKNNPNKVKAVASASAIGWYGADTQPSKSGFVETDPPVKDFLGETCRLWEESIEPVQQLGKRLVKLRTGIVLSKDGGALAEFKKPIRFGIAGILGDGKQIVSWIHVDDLCRLYIDALENDQLSGSYNAVAPQPVSNKELTIELAKKMKGSAYIPAHVPTFVLKIMLGDRSMEVLKSATVSCEKIKKSGFTFLFPTLEAALPTLV